MRTLNSAVCCSVLFLAARSAHAQPYGYGPQGGAPPVEPASISPADDCDPDIEPCVGAPEEALPDEALDDGYDPQAYQQFENDLAPYGSWVDDPSYGRIWVPSPQAVGASFVPYESEGNWVSSSDYG